MEIVARYAKRNRVENTRSSKAWGSGGLCRWRHGCDHWVSGPLPFSDHFRQTPWLAVGAYRGTALFIANSLVQNLPNETTQAVSNGPDRLLVFQARLQALKDDFKNASVPLDCGMCGFMEQPPQSAVAFGRTATASFPGGDFLDRAQSACDNKPEWYRAWPRRPLGLEPCARVACRFRPRWTSPDETSAIGRAGVRH